MPKYEIREESTVPEGVVIGEVDAPDSESAMVEAMRLINAYYGRPWIQDQIRSLNNYGN